MTAQRNAVAKKPVKNSSKDARFELAVIKLFAKNSEDDETFARKVVGMMAKMEPRRIWNVVKTVLDTTTFPADRMRRMAACAERGLTSAAHLYGPTRIVTHVAIMGSTKAALEQLANPEEQIEIRAENGRSVFKTLKDVSSLDARTAFSSDKGFLPASKQCRYMTPEKSKPVLNKKHPCIESCLPRNGSIILRMTDGNEYTLNEKDRARLLKVL